MGRTRAIIAKESSTTGRPPAANSWLLFLLSFLISYCAMRWCSLSTPPTDECRHVTPPETRNYRSLMMVGVMTSQDLVETRGLAVWHTWAQHVPGRVVFFSGENTTAPAASDLPLVALPGTDDKYPPQKKAMLMIKYMSERWGSEYEWFLRMDDDAHVNVPKLANFLRSLDSSKKYYLGLPGQGKPDELGKLGLGPNENFCQGGPGVIMSYKTINSVAPHVKDCLQNLYSHHEDTEIGRCVTKHSGVKCSWNYQMRDLFHQNQNVDKESKYYNYAHVIPGTFHKAHTFHPIKNPAYQYHLHALVLSHRIQEERQHRLDLLKELYQTKALLLETDTLSHTERNLGSPPELNLNDITRREDILQWDYLTPTQVFSARNLNPARRHEASLVEAIEIVLVEIVNVINKNGHLKGRTLEFKKFEYAYKQVNPLHGVTYILQMKFLVQHHGGERKKTVHKYVYVRKPFAESIIKIQFVDGRLPIHINDSLSNNKLSFRQRLNHRISKLLYSPSMYFEPDDTKEMVHFILPLSGRFDTFLHYIHRFEDICIKKNESVSLTVVVFDDKEGRAEDTVEVIHTLAAKYQAYSIRKVRLKGRFNRGVALAAGAAHLPHSALLLFLDVDILLTKAALARIRSQTMYGSQVALPIMFSQYNPDTFQHSQPTLPKDSKHNPLNLSERNGYWRRHSFGITALYKSDFIAAGGFDTSIQGWGKEDLDLCERLLHQNMTINRWGDPGFIHIFHPIVCDEKLNNDQMHMCLGTRYATHAAVPYLADIIIQNKTLTGH